MPADLSAQIYDASSRGNETDSVQENLPSFLKPGPSNKRTTRSEAIRGLIEIARREVMGATHTLRNEANFSFRDQLVVWLHVLDAGAKPASDGKDVDDVLRTLISRIGGFHHRLMLAVLMIGAQRAKSLSKSALLSQAHIRSRPRSDETLKQNIFGLARGLTLLHA
jgi:hypothetical protein